MDFNLTRIVFISNAATVTLLGLLINVLEKFLPIWLTRTYRYGKFAAIADHAFVSKLEIPKRWFKHFYAFAAPASSVALALTAFKYICNIEVPNFVYHFLDTLFGTHRQALVSAESSLLAMILLTIQCWKRFYESHCISIFSDRNMNVGHYILGFIHYAGVIFCMIGESEGFVRGSSAVLRWDRLTFLQYVCAIVFLWASYEQLRTNYILANLRKNKKGEVVTKSYKIPHGRLFEYISSPLQLTEITIYMMLSIILWKTSTYHYVFLWVLANQIESATLSHVWSRKTFKDYPKQRKIVIPYLY